MKTKGFTLVELLVVIAILAILATVSVVGYTSFINRAEQSNDATEAHQIETSIETALIVSNVVLVRDAVEATDDTAAVSAIYAVKDTDGDVTFVATYEGTETPYDISDDVAELAGDLVIKSATELTYKTAKITID